MLGGKSLQIATRALGTTTVFDVTGDIDLANSPEVRKALLSLVRAVPGAPVGELVEETRAWLRDHPGDSEMEEALAALEPAVPAFPDEPAGPAFPEEPASPEEPPVTAS